MNPKYPNLELIEYKFTQLLNELPEYAERAFNHRSKYRFFQPCFTIQVFPQMWGSTNRGFDITDDGRATIGGCAMTQEYTTVIHEEATDIYGVFFGSLPCYTITSPTQEFFEDMNIRQMASKSEARKRYMPCIELAKEPF